MSAVLGLLGNPWQSVGFYFLTFGTVELVANFMECRHLTRLRCSSYECFAELSALSFPKGSTVYVYLLNAHFTQNIIEGVDVDNGSVDAEDIYGDSDSDCCSHYATNVEMAKNASVVGTVLEPSAKAFPCGQLAFFFPQSTFTVTNTDTDLNLTVKADGLSLTDFGLRNTDLAKQWADVESSRFSAWNEKHVAFGISKFWGYIEDEVTGNIRITLHGTSVPTQPTTLCSRSSPTRCTLSSPTMRRSMDATSLCARSISCGVFPCSA